MSTDTTLMTTAQVAEMILGHLAEYDLPEPASLHIDAHGYRRPVTLGQLATWATGAGVAA